MLTSEQKKAIRQLQKKVQQKDAIKLKLNWDLLASERAETKMQGFFHYDAEGNLLGFFAVFCFGNKVECVGMVDPTARRRGIARVLLESVMEEWRGHVKRFLLNTPENSTSGHLFIEAVGGVYAFTEHEMMCSEVPLPASLTGMRIRPAVLDDGEAIYRLDADGFGMTTNEARSLYAGDGARVGTYMIEEHNEVVGKLRLDRQKGESWIFGFVVAKEKRGRGIGRAALTDIVHREVTAGNQVWLEVAVNNASALSLYQSCGFKKVQGAQCYYDMA
ncbi:GNAT family N-acetyltransferase [Shouchella shacheensis]|uniref:GNAT family N-acetyltransferase n=1 Tax=Shouchella shacheensis TaxID=1649580 RepID=UPI0007404B0F|nr:GNAT family N-acetyltransferase [Shouchella shacheensis]